MKLLRIDAEFMTCGLFFSEISVELPFTLMHPKPLEESIYRDGESLHPT